MKQRAVVVAPGRGTYNKAELGTLARFHGDKADLIAQFDNYRQAQGQETVSALDGAARFSVAKHTRGDNASPLIFACGLADFMSIDRERYEIVAVTGNSMGWYTALACAGAVSPMDGFKIANTMGTLMQQSLIGEQLIYPFVDDEWRPIPGLKGKLLSTVEELNDRKERILTVSIELGGMLVLAGNHAGLQAFEKAVPQAQGRFPMRLQNHAAFHSHLQEPVAAEGRLRIGQEVFGQPGLPMIDGRGHIWRPKAASLTDLYEYTLGHQIVDTFNFTKAIRTAMFEYMPDIVFVLGPGTTLGGATAQSLLISGWRGLRSKLDFKDRLAQGRFLVSLGDPEMARRHFVSP